MATAYKHILTWLATLCLGVFCSTASATLIISDVELTSDSVSFTVNGNMQGYADPSRRSQFSIQYLGDIWAGLDGYSANTWSGSAFDSHVIHARGNTGSWGSNTPYSWSVYNCSLFDAIATDQRVTLSMDRNYLNTSATDGALRFVWGNGHSYTYQRTLHTEYFGSAAASRSSASGLSLNATAVPEPSTFVLLGLGLAGIGFARRLARV